MLVLGYGVCCLAGGLSHIEIIMSENTIMRNLKGVLSKIEAACSRRNQILPKIQPRLVCVSKTKPTSDIIEAYNAGHRHFGENYANELNDKAISQDILEKCKEIKWHFIGHLQSNKLSKVLACPGLFMIETIHSIKLADALDKNWIKYAKGDEKLNVLIQVNTSGEDAKNGVEPSDVVELALHIREKCPNLMLKGLMTIGLYGYDCSQGTNPDFVSLVKCREVLCSELGLDIASMELSMGMSTDFEHAIELGATNVRVGSTIFGNRNNI